MERTTRTDLGLPLVSVVIPVFNGAPHLLSALASIREQSYRNVEVIIVDDGSTDNAAPLFAACAGARYLSQANAGPAAARNRGIAAAAGELIAFLDADDLWPGGSLSLRVERLLRRPGVDVVTGQVQCIDASGRFLFIPAAPRRVSACHHLGAALFKKRVFEKVGLFEPALRYSEDHDWFLRAREVGVSIEVLPQATLYYRRHENNMTKSKDALSFQLPRVLHRVLRRRRLGRALTAAPAVSVETGDHRGGELGRVR